MYHSFFYPGDVDARVPYVAPLNYSIEDERIYSFLDQVGHSAERRKVKRFQKLALRHQDRYIPAFRQFCETKGYTYEITGGIEKAIDDGLTTVRGKIYRQTLAAKRFDDLFK